METTRARWSRPMWFIGAALAVWASWLSAVEGADGPVNWPRFRGPNGQGVAEGVRFPAAWAGTDYLWKVRLAGGGHSSPVVWGDRVFITGADPKTATRHIQCLAAADGRVLWTKTYEGTPCHLNPLNAYASSTPALDAERLYLSWASPTAYIVVALTHDGREVWRADLGPWKSQHGYGTSPMVVGDLVVLTNDQQGPSSMVALDAATGRTRWKVPRPSGRAAYAVPALYRDAGGRTHLVVASQAAGVAGLDPATGRALWQVPGALPERVVASPVLAGDLVLTTCGTGGRGRHVIAVRPPQSEGANAVVVWKMTSDAPYAPTAVARGDRVYLWTESGVVSCLEAATGRRLWRERVGGKFYASPIVVGGRLYNVSTKGEVVALASAERFRLLGRTDLGEKSQATPAVAGGRMFLRTWSHLMALPAER